WDEPLFANPHGALPRLDIERIAAQGGMPYELAVDADLGALDHLDHETPDLGLAQSQGLLRRRTLVACAERGVAQEGRQVARRLDIATDLEFGLAEVAQNRGVRLERVRLLESQARRFVFAHIDGRDALEEAFSGKLHRLRRRLPPARQ